MRHAHGANATDELQRCNLFLLPPAFSDRWSQRRVEFGEIVDAIQFAPYGAVCLDCGDSGSLENGMPCRCSKGTP